MPNDPYRRRIALDQVAGQPEDPVHAHAEVPSLGDVCRAQIRVGRELMPARLLSLDLQGLRCAASVVFPPATFLVLEIDGQAVGVGAFEITGLVSRSERHEHTVTFYAADIVARERLQKLLFALHLRDEHWQRPAEVTRIVSALPTSSDELATLRALVTQLAFERDEARRALAEERARHAITREHLEGERRSSYADSDAWFPHTAEMSAPPSYGISEVVLAALQDDNRDDDSGDEDTKDIELAADAVMDRWRATRLSHLDDLQAERDVAYAAVRCDIDVTTPMALRHRRRSPFSSAENTPT